MLPATSRARPCEANLAGSSIMSSWSTGKIRLTASRCNGHLEFSVFGATSAEFQGVVKAAKLTDLAKYGEVSRSTRKRQLLAFNWRPCLKPAAATQHERGGAVVATEPVRSLLPRRSLRNLKEALRLCSELGLGLRQDGSSCSIGPAGACRLATALLSVV